MKIDELKNEIKHDIHSYECDYLFFFAILSIKLEKYILMASTVYCPQTTRIEHNKRYYGLRVCICEYVVWRDGESIQIIMKILGVLKAYTLLAYSFSIAMLKS